MPSTTERKMNTKTKAAPLLNDEQKADRLPAVRKPRAAPHQEPQRMAPPAATTPMDMIAAASMRGASPEELGKLMDLLDRHQRREAEQAFARAMVQFKKQAPTVYKESAASFTGKTGLVEYDFATLGHICEKIIAVLADCGISHHWTPDQPASGPDAGMMCMTATLTHEQGHTRSSTFKFPSDPSGTKNPLQAIGSAGTYGERYSLLAVCGIAVKQQPDDDGNGTTKTTTSLADTWLAKVAAAPTDVEVLKVWDAGIVAIDKAKDLTAHKLFKDAVAERRADFAAKGGAK